MNTQKYTIGVVTVVALVVLRLALGWHFLYEGVWKINHPVQFVAETEGFLSGARGPAAGVFYAMVPDLDGHQRLVADLAEAPGKNSLGKELSMPKLAAKDWNDLRQQFVEYYRPRGKDADGELHKQLAAEAGLVYDRHVKGLCEFTRENGDKIKAHFRSLARFQEARKTDPSTAFLTQRRWDEMQELRKEAKGWMADLASRQVALKAELLDLLNAGRKAEIDAVRKAEIKEAEKEAEKKAAEAKKKTDAKAKADAPAPKNAADDKPAELPRDPAAGATAKTEPAPAKQPAAGDPQAAKDAKPAIEAKTPATADFSSLAAGKPALGPFVPSRNPFAWTRIEQLASLLTWSLFGIGLCLMLGLCTRPAALAGAGFMLFVVLSQPSYPGVYPTDPPQLGHALLVNKDFVEMVALLLIVTTPIGRWTGLDYFVYHFWKRCCCKSDASAPKEGAKA